MRAIIKTPHTVDATVFIDGVEEPLCLAADEEAGVVLCHVWTETADRLLLSIKYGVVEIRLNTPEHRAEV